MLDVSHWSYTCFVNYFPQSVNYISVFLMVFFNAQKFLILIAELTNVYSFAVCGFYVLSRKYVPTTRS